MFRKLLSSTKKAPVKQVSVTKTEEKKPTFKLTGLKYGSAWSLDNSRISDFSFAKLYDQCSIK